MKAAIDFMGNLTADCTHVFANDDGSAKRLLFTVAVNSSYKKNGKKEQSVDFIPCIAWDKLSDVLVAWGFKGRKVHVRGTLESYQPGPKEDGTYEPTKLQVRVGNIEFVNFEERAKDKAEAGKTETTKPAAAKTEETKSEETPAVSPTQLAELANQLLQAMGKKGGNTADVTEQLNNLI